MYALHPVLQGRFFSFLPKSSIAALALANSYWHDVFKHQGVVLEAIPSADIPADGACFMNIMVDETAGGILPAALQKWGNRVRTYHKATPSDDPIPTCIRCLKYSNRVPLRHLASTHITSLTLSYALPAHLLPLALRALHLTSARTSHDPDAPEITYESLTDLVDLQISEMVQSEYARNLPPNLRSLELCVNGKLSSRLPISLRRLAIRAEIPNDYHFPPQLRNLSVAYIGSTSPQTIFPPHLLHLQIMNANLHPGIIPDGVEELVAYWCRIDDGAIPESVRRLKFVDIWRLPTSLPEGLESVVLCNVYNYQMKPGFLPSSLRTLELPDCNVSWAPGSLPEGLVRLVCGKYQKCAFRKGVLPSTLRHLDVGAVFNRSCQYIPENLETLVLSRNYSKGLGSQLPRNLKRLILPKTWQGILNQRMPRAGSKQLVDLHTYLGPSIEYLEIGEAKFVHVGERKFRRVA